MSNKCIVQGCKDESQTPQRLWCYFHSELWFSSAEFKRCSVLDGPSKLTAVMDFNHRIEAEKRNEK